MLHVVLDGPVPLRRLHPGRPHKGYFLAVSYALPQALQIDTSDAVKLENAQSSLAISFSVGTGPSSLSGLRAHGHHHDHFGGQRQKGARAPERALQVDELAQPVEVDQRTQRIARETQRQITTVPVRDRLRLIGRQRLRLQVPFMWRPGTRLASAVLL